MDSASIVALTFRAVSCDWGSVSCDNGQRVYPVI